MRVHRGTYARGLSVTAALLWIAASPSAAFPGEFFSWIDASGTMVITDDSGQIPPPTQRSQIAVHRFVGKATPATMPDGRLPVARGADPTPPVRGPSESERVAPEQKTEPQPHAVDPADLDLPQVLLDAPEETVKTQYAWMPLLSPIYLGPSPVSGFWYHRKVHSPVDAFKQFLRQQPQHLQHLQGGQAVAGGSQMPYGGVPNGPPSTSNPIYNSGNYVYDQVMRERQALNERIASQMRPASQTSPQCCGKGSSRVGSGPSGSKQ
ncbi:MAG: hypothetical protein ACREIH_00715 [Nitrospiraceae bacterium]